MDGYRVEKRRRRARRSLRDFLDWLFRKGTRHFVAKRIASVINCEERGFVDADMIACGSLRTLRAFTSLRSTTYDSRIRILSEGGFPVGSTLLITWGIGSADWEEHDCCRVVIVSPTEKETPAAHVRRDDLDWSLSTTRHTQPRSIALVRLSLTSTPFRRGRAPVAEKPARHDASTSFRREFGYVIGNMNVSRFSCNRRDFFERGTRDIATVRAVNVKIFLLSEKDNLVV